MGKLLAAAMVTVCAAAIGCTEVRNGYGDATRSLNNMDPSSVDWDEIEIRRVAQRKHPAQRVQEIAVTGSPVSDGNGNVYVCDANGRIHCYCLNDGSMKVHHEGNGPVRQLAYRNGLLAADAEGRMIRHVGDADRPLVIEHIPQLRDIAVDAEGGLYLAVGADESMGQPGGAVYYVSPRGESQRIIDLPDPVALELAPDDARLYVADRKADQLFAFTLMEPGQAVGWSRMSKLSDAGIDIRDVTVDEDGNVYLATSEGVRVIWPNGKLRDLIPMNEPVNGIAFAGPDSNWFFMTTPSSLYRMQLTTEGK